MQCRIDDEIRVYRRPGYVQEGQRLVVVRVNWLRFQDIEPYDPLQVTDWLLFRDLARGIDGAIPVFVGNSDLLDDRYVWRAYDNYNYRHNLTLEEIDGLNRAVKMAI